jgi:hypothetical protein
MLAASPSRSSPTQSPRASGRSRDTEMSGWAMAEFIVGEATLGWRPGEIVELIRDLRDRAISDGAVNPSHLPSR